MLKEQFVAVSIGAMVSEHFNRVMELVNSDRVEALESALDFISQHAEKFLGVVPEKYLLDCDRPAIAL